MTEPEATAIAEMESLDFNETLLAKDPPAFREALADRGLRCLTPGVGDPLGTALIEAKPWTKLLYVVLAATWAAFPPLAAHLEGNFANPELKPDVIGDLGYWNQYAFALPVAILLISMYFGRLPRTIAELTASKAIQMVRSDWNRYCEEANAIFSRRSVRWLPYLTGTLISLALVWIWLIGERGTWFSLRDGHLAGLLLLPQYFLLYFVIAFMVTRVVATYFVLRRFFAFPLNIQPLHPDGCGGLAPLGRLSMQLNLGVFLFGFVAALGVYSVSFVYEIPLLDPRNIVIFIGYFIAAAILFFLPPLPSSRHMRKAKLGALLKISDSFNRLNLTFLENLSNDEKVDRSVIEEMRSLKEAHEIIADMPVFPFNPRSVSSFIGSVLGVPITMALFHPTLHRLFHLFFPSS